MKSTLTFLFFFAVSSNLYAQYPACFEEYNESEKPYRLEKFTIDNNGVALATQLLLPKEEGIYPAVLLLPGGGNNVTNLQNVPLYLGRRAAACGLIMLYYDKRGTGESGGDYTKADFNDLLDDASVAIDYLSNHKEVNRSKIGASGFSQGGRLIANLAVRNKKVSYIAGVSGPINKVGPNRYYAFKNSLDRTQLSDSMKQVILPYWEEHFNALEAKDEARSIALDKEIAAVEGVGRQLLPPYHADRDRMPIYNSMGMDLLSELTQLSIPWLSIYGEDDPVVDAKESKANIEKLMQQAGNANYVIQMLPGLNHALFNPETRERFDFEARIVEWVLNITGG